MRSLTFEPRDTFSKHIWVHLRMFDFIIAQTTTELTSYSQDWRLIRKFRGVHRIKIGTVIFIITKATLSHVSKFTTHIFKKFQTLKYGNWDYFTWIWYFNFCLTPVATKIDNLILNYKKIQIYNSEIFKKQIKISNINWNTIKIRII